MANFGNPLAFASTDDNLKPAVPEESIARGLGRVAGQMAGGVISGAGQAARAVGGAVAGAVKEAAAGASEGFNPPPVPGATPAQIAATPTGIPSNLPGMEVPKFTPAALPAAPKAAVARPSQTVVASAPKINPATWEPKGQNIQGLPITAPGKDGMPPSFQALSPEAAAQRGLIATPEIIAATARDEGMGLGGRPIGLRGGEDELHSDAALRLRQAMNYMMGLQTAGSGAISAFRRMTPDQLAALHQRWEDAAEQAKIRAMSPERAEAYQRQKEIDAMRRRALWEQTPEAVTAAAERQRDTDVAAAKASSTEEAADRTSYRETLRSTQSHLDSLGKQLIEARKNAAMSGSPEDATAVQSLQDEWLNWSQSLRDMQAGGYRAWKKQQSDEEAAKPAAAAAPAQKTPAPVQTQAQTPGMVTIKAPNGQTRQFASGYAKTYLASHPGYVAL